MKLYKNIVEEKDRKKLLKFVKTKVKYWNDKVPGLQTPMDLHTHPETQHFYKKILQKYFKDMSIQYSWANYSEGDIINWHNHPAATISAVYFLKNPDNLGTIFRNEKYSYDKITSTKCPENSLLVFDASKIHSQPYSPKKIKRYSIAIDLL
jgi:hypothetical protein